MSMHSPSTGAPRARPLLACNMLLACNVRECLSVLSACRSSSRPPTSSSYCSASRFLSSLAALGHGPSSSVRANALALFSSVASTIAS
eukprot:756429-Hanusia_phi.AAC.2